MKDDSFTVTALKEYLEELIMDGKGDYKVVDSYIEHSIWRESVTIDDKQKKIAI